MSGQARISVAVTTRPIEKGVTGSGMHLDRLLRALVESTNDIDLFFLRTSDKPLWTDDYGESIRISRNPLQAQWQLRDRRFDVVHYSPLSVLSPILAKAGARCATLHPDDELIVPQLYSWRRRLHSRYAVGWLARQMDRIFTVSETSAALISRVYGIAAQRIILTPNAADERFRPCSEDAAKAVAVRQGVTQPYILHISNLSERKNPWVLLEGFALLRARVGDHLRLVVVGNGWKQSEKVENCLRRLAIRGAVKLLGFAPTEDIPLLLCGAEAFVFPSLSEGFGMPNLEAMACGCPVVTSSSFAIPEIVQKAAIILRDKRDPAELAASLEAVITDPALAAELRRCGLERAAAFDWRRSARVLADTYRSLARHGAGASGEEGGR